MLPAIKRRGPKVLYYPCPGSSGVEQWTENPRVGGSNPPPGTNYQQRLVALFFRKQFLV